MFRYLAFGGGLVLLLLWGGPFVVQAARRTMKKSQELYDASAEADAEQPTPEDTNEE